ncbi:MAG: hypothetical protein KDK99_19255, partial [Verrucomicrobiales bacterium]|nr:hypothetical protein [Verrucomicrobiales bacterium]
LLRQGGGGVGWRVAGVRDRAARGRGGGGGGGGGGGRGEGARVGYPARVAGGFVLDAALRAEGLMATQVRLVPQGYAEAVEDPRRETDAQVSVEPWLTLLCKQGWNRRWEAERLENGYWTVLAVRASAWRRHPGELQRLIAVEAVAAKQVQEGQLTAEETQVLLRHLGLEEGDWQGVMQGLWWPDVEQGQEALEDLDSEFWRHTRQVHEFLTKEGTVTGAWDPSAWLWEGGR